MFISRFPLCGNIHQKPNNAAAEIFAKIAREKMAEALRNKRQKLQDRLRKEIADKTRRLRLAQIGRANATIAARRVLAQARCSRFCT